MSKKIKADQFETTGTDTIKTSDGPTDLEVGAIADGEYLRRSGTTVIGAPGGTTAESLGTTGADVDVGSAAPPSAGQVLKASDPTHATWQDDSTTDADAIHKSTAAEISTVAEKASPVSADLLLIEDSADSNNKKRLQVGNLPGGTDANAIHVNAASEISGITEKASPVSADLIVIEDSEDSNNKKRVQVGNLPGGSGGAVSQYIGTGRWEFLDEIQVGSDVTSVAFGAGGDGSYGAALDGDVDGEYLLEWYLPSPGAANVRCTYRPNGITADQVSGRQYGGTSSGGGTSSDLQFYEEGSVSRSGNGYTHIFAASGKPRYFITNGCVAIIPESTSGIFADQTVGVWDDTATNITTLELVATAASAIKSGARFRLYRSSSNRGNAVTAGALEFMDIIEVTSDQTSVSFGASGDGAFQRPLDGDVDEVYEIQALWVPPATNLSNLALRPNGVSTNQETAWSYYNGSAASSNSDTALILGRTDSTTGLAQFTVGTLYAKSGVSRLWNANESLQPNAAANVVGRVYGGVWYESVTNITSLDLVSATASGIKAGSRFVLYRRTRSNLRADSANTYERRVESAVEVGTATTEQTTGNAVYGGSVVGLSVRLEEAVTAGTVVVNLKADGVTKLSVTLDTTVTQNGRATAGIGEQMFLAGDNLSVEIVATGYDNSGSITSGITVVVHLVNSALYLRQPTTDRRLDPDSSDLLVYDMVDVTPTSLVNKGSAGSSGDLTGIGNPKSYSGLFDTCFDSQGRTDKAIYYGAAGVAEPSSITLSFWVKPKTAESSLCRWITKEYRNDNTWVSPWYSVSVETGGTTTIKGYVTIGGANKGITVGPNFGFGLGMWHHCGLTWDETTGLLSFYWDGQAYTYTHTPGVIDYGTHGTWVVGGVRSTGAPSEHASCQFEDVRVANVVRSAAWFENIWRQGLRLT